jgi:purine-binding chemotaxis protein CheW
VLAGRASIFPRVCPAQLWHLWYQGHDRCHLGLQRRSSFDKGMAVHTPYLTFCLQGACYAVEASQVREILRLPALTPITEAPRYIIGIVNYRGHILPVMDLGLRLGQPPRPYQIHDHVIVLEQESRLLGVLVNEVYGVHEILPETLETPAALAEWNAGGARFIRHLTKLDTTAIMVLDHALLLSTAVDHRVDVDHARPALPDVRWQQSTEHTPARNDTPANPFEIMPLFFHNAAPWEREILLERARNLTSSLEEQSVAQQIPLAVVGLSGEYFGVELGTVREFTDLQRITPVPCCPDYIVGDMNLRGDILTVVDIRGALRMPVVEADPTAKVIVVPVGDGLVGVLVEQVFDVFDLDPLALTAVPSAIKAISDTYLKGTVACHGKMLAILDLPKILTDGGLTVNEEA